MEKIVQRIIPQKSFCLNFRELWQYRELFIFFTWRDIKVKYKHTTLGIAWVLIQPLGLLALFSLVFSGSLKINTITLPYSIFVFSGLLLWHLFNTSVYNAGESMIQHASIIRKIYFPRLIIPTSSVLVAIFDFTMAFIVFILFCIVKRIKVDKDFILLIPSGILMTILTAWGLGVFISALNIKYRDFRYTIPFLLQLFFFSATIIYPFTNIKLTWLKIILALNPLNASLELFRAPFQNGQMDLKVIWIGSAIMILFLACGLLFFKKTEAYFADIA